LYVLLGTASASAGGGGGGGGMPGGFTMLGTLLLSAALMRLLSGPDPEPEPRSDPDPVLFPVSVLDPAVVPAVEAAATALLGTFSFAAVPASPSGFPAESTSPQFLFAEFSSL
jgi:hypothetical protein